MRNLLNTCVLKTQILESVIYILTLMQGEDNLIFYFTNLHAQVKALNNVLLQAIIDFASLICTLSYLIFFVAFNVIKVPLEITRGFALGLS